VTGAVAWGLIAGAVGMAIGDLVSSEIRGRLERIPLWLIRVAARHLDRDARESGVAEWTAELHAVLREHDADAIPLAGLAIGIRFALGVIRAARTIERDNQATLGVPLDPGPRLAGPQLLNDLVSAEQSRVSHLINQIRGGRAAYEGDDQDWLLALTRNAKVSLEATHLVVVTPSGAADMFFWDSAVGHQYLDAQRELIAAGAVVQRLFILERRCFATDPAFSRHYRRQRAAGVRARILVAADWSPGRPEQLRDLILFDRVISYEARCSPMGTTPNPGARSTVLHVEPAQVERHHELFDQLWTAGVALDG
jgi:hypothetical protein